jgi:hypothetical protein
LDVDAEEEALASLEEDTGSALPLPLLLLLLH